MTEYKITDDDLHKIEAMGVIVKVHSHDNKLVQEINDLIDKIISQKLINSQP